MQNYDSSLKTIDHLSFAKAYDLWHEFARTSYESNIDAKDLEAKHNLGSYEAILFAGMGGSATAGEILASLLDNSKIKCSVLKGSSLPENVDRNTLVFASSISGNTYETIQVVKSCQKRGIDVITLSSGGLIQKIADSNGISHIKVQDLGAPRISLPCLVYPLLKVLKSLEPSCERQAESSLTSLRSLSKLINSSVPIEKNPAKQLAKFMHQIIPVCYYSSAIKAAGIRFKNSLNENSKRQAICDQIEESCHNGIVPFAFEDKKRYGVILLRSNMDDIVLRKRFDIVREYLEEEGVKVYEVHGYGESLLANMMSSIYLLDYSTIYLAFMNGYDPAITPAIDYVKSAIGSLL